MMLMLLILNLLGVRFLFCSDIEFQVYPLIAEFERMENLEPLKYSKEQFQMIQQVIDLKGNWIRVMTYNVLFDVKDEDLDFQYKWPQRRSKVSQLIKLINPDILCVQELKANQLDDLMSSLWDSFNFYGEPVVLDGDIDGIFFRKDRFAVLDKRTTQLGWEGDVHSLTNVIFYDQLTHKQFSVFNTHLPYSSCESRLNSAIQISENITHSVALMPVIFAGDLNTIPQRLDYKGLPFYDGDYVKNIIKGSVLFDSFDRSILGHLGPISTYTNGPESNNGIPFAGTGVPGIILDHIFTTDDIKIVIHAVEKARINGRFPSDHMPVIVDLLIP